MRHVEEWFACLCAQTSNRVAWSTGDGGSGFGARRRCARFDVERATMAARMYTVVQFSLISGCLFVGQQVVVTAWAKCGVYCGVLVLEFRRARGLLRAAVDQLQGFVMSCLDKRHECLSTSPHVPGRIQIGNSYHFDTS